MKLCELLVLSHCTHLPLIYLPVPPLDRVITFPPPWHLLFVTSLTQRWLETLLHFEVFWIFLKKYSFDRWSRLPVCLSLPYYAHLVKIWRANLPWKFKKVKLCFFWLLDYYSSPMMCTSFVARVLHIWPLQNLATGTCAGRSSVAGRTKTLTEVDMWRWSDFDFLMCGDIGRTHPVSVFVFPRVYCPDSSKALERRDDRADSVRNTVNRVGRRLWKRSSVALKAAARTTSTEKMAWAFVGFRGTRNFDDVRWVAALRLQSVRENCENL